MAYEQLVSVPSSATSGQVPKANGSGGYTWETPKAYYEKPSGGIPESDLASAVQTSLGKADSAYQKPSGGIPKTDLAESYTSALVFTNVSATFAYDTSQGGSPTYTNYPYRAVVALTDVTATMVPFVTFSLEDAISGNYAPVAETYAGGAYLYGTDAGTVTVPTIMCIEGS